MFFCIMKGEDLPPGWNPEELEKEIRSKFSPETAAILQKLIRFPDLLQGFVEWTSESLPAELVDFLERQQRNKKQIQVPSQSDVEVSVNKEPEISPAVTSSLEKSNKKENKRRKKKRSHAGARGHAAFPGAKHVVHSLAKSLCAGQACSCQMGKLYAIPPGRSVYFEAASLLQAILHETEKLRCNSCGSVFGAHLPPEITEREKYHKALPDAAAACVLFRYGLGFPDLRLERLQGWQGNPISNSRQWAIALQAALELKPLWESFLTRASNATSLICDDAYSKIITEMKAISEEIKCAQEKGISENNIRTSVQTSLVVARGDDGHDVHLCLSGREHQGEVIYELLKERDEDLPPVCLTTDAAAKARALKPFPEKSCQGFYPHQTKKGSAENLHIIQAHCLEHLRLTFEKASDHFPKIVRDVLGFIGQVYANDAEAVKVYNLSPQERQLFHCEHSTPLMESLKKYLLKIQESRLVEPNSPTGRAIAYAQNHWNNFTEFLRTPGVFLDTNPCERDVYYVILHRLNSLHYQTLTGAEVGDFFMSIAATCRGQNINPLRYLTACLEFPRDVGRKPQDWYPWNFEKSYSEALSKREQEWDELRKERDRKGYRQLVRTKKPLEETCPQTVNPMSSPPPV